MSCQYPKICVLGIETSCDETAASLIKVDSGKIELLSNVVASQVKIHQQYGGVVPEVAARNHVHTILPTIEKAMGDFDIDVIAVTAGPGLFTSLLVGTETAKALSYVWKKPLVAVNHIEGHIYANWLANNKIEFPAIVLIISGGHTELVLMKGHGQFERLGHTLDDAAGEAFDKVAKLMDLGYPGGPAIEKLARAGDATAVQLPRPMIDSADLNFSFSGLKTAVLYYLRKQKQLTKKIKADLAASFQAAAAEVLVTKTIKAAEQHDVKSILVAGGVAANSPIKKELRSAANKNGFPFHAPDLKFSTDNAAMIATAGYFKAKQKKFTPWSELKVDPNLRIS